MDTLMPVLLILAVILIYYGAASSHPLRKCPRCGGKGTLDSGLIKGRFRICPRCERKGEITG
ncbi:DnaJ-like cysteine-rich domain-containing protein [Herbidospora sp. RD11066]